MTRLPHSRATIDEIISQLEVPITNRRTVRQIADRCGVSRQTVERVGANPSKYLTLVEPDVSPVYLEDPRPCPDCDRSVTLWSPWPGGGTAPRCWFCYLRRFKANR